MKKTCKECDSKYSAGWRKRNPDYMRKYYLANKEKIIAQKQKYLKENPEKRRATSAKYYRNNSKKLKAYQKELYLKNKLKEGENKLYNV